MSLSSSLSKSHCLSGWCLNASASSSSPADIFHHLEQLVLVFLDLVELDVLCFLELFLQLVDLVALCVLELVKLVVDLCTQFVDGVLGGSDFSLPCFLFFDLLCFIDFEDVEVFPFFLLLLE